MPGTFQIIASFIYLVTSFPFSLMKMMIFYTSTQTKPSDNRPQTREKERIFEKLKNFEKQSPTKMVVIRIGNTLGAAKTPTITLTHSHSFTYTHTCILLKKP